MHSAIDMNKIQPPNHKVTPIISDANGARKREIRVEKEKSDVIADLKGILIFMTFIKFVIVLFYENYYSRVLCVFFEVIGIVGYMGTFVSLIKLHLVYIVTHSLAVSALYFVNLETVITHAPVFSIEVLFSRRPPHLDGYTEYALIIALFYNYVRFRCAQRYTEAIVFNRNLEKFKKIINSPSY